ncbi:MAG: hypothetical protein DRP65_02905 [Planctomycetota bacterium]|nr:MAG: hypothetical protein DRP65_02905 [Planctomycetota bacterium]
MSRARLIFIVFYLTTLLIAAAGLRISASRLFYKFNKAVVTQNRLRQTLWQKQLELQNLTNPHAVSERME